MRRAKGKDVVVAMADGSSKYNELTEEVADERQVIRRLAVKRIRLAVPYQARNVNHHGHEERELV